MVSNQLNHLYFWVNYTKGPFGPVVTEETRVICRKRKYLCVWPDDFGDITFLKTPKNDVLKLNQKAMFSKTQFLTFLHRIFLLSKFLK